MVHVDDFALEYFSAPTSGDVSSHSALRRTGEESEIQMKYDRLVAQLSNVALECDTWHYLPRVWADDIINARAFLDTSNEKYKLL